MRIGWRSRGWLLTTFSVACLAVVGWSVFLRSEPADLTAGHIDRAEVDSLAAYVSPSASMPALDDYEVHLPALPPRVPVDSEGFTAEPPEDPDPSWELSAILIAGGRPLAIIDDQQVRPGDRLPDGTLVEQIESTQVIVQDTRGRRHALRITAGGGGF